jgi:dCMP deaminase
MLSKFTPRHLLRKAPMAEHRAWLVRAAALAQKPVSKGGSPHPTVKVGAIIVDAKGRELAASSNRFPRGVNRRPERLAEDGKSLWINCAEQLAIAEAARRGVSLKGARLYLTLKPCTICAGLMVEAGIRDVFLPKETLRRYARLKAKWQKSIEAGLVKLAEAGVRVTAVDMDGES